MSLRSQAQSLKDHLEGNPWLCAVGSDGEGLIVYTTSRAKSVLAKIPAEWRGLRVRAERMGKATPLR